MLAISLFSAYLICLTAASATARGARSPAAMVEHGSAVLVWLERHKEPGTPRSRARLRGRSHALVWRGLTLAGVLPGFLCIHQHESRNWYIYNPPYAGGLQMDSSFQASYGPEYLRLWGNASHWPPWAQLVAGYRAWQTRGWTPWPNTARACGLF